MLIEGIIKIVGGGCWMLDAGVGWWVVSALLCYLGADKKEAAHAVLMHSHSRIRL